MEDYRLYRLKPDNSIANATDFAAKDDTQAMAEAVRMAHSDVIEIWQSKRRVARVDPGGA